MFFHFNLRSATCIKNSDHVFGDNSEYYWTWLVYSQTEDNEDYNVAQGFSMGCEMDSGYDFNDSNSRYFRMNDPRFTVSLPEVARGESRKITFELYCWESDNSTIEVKKTFTNYAAEKLLKIWQETDAKKTKTKEEFLKWLEESDNSALAQIISMAQIEANYLKIAKLSIDVIKWAIEIVKTNGDDFIGAKRCDLIISNEAEGIKYRWIFEDGTEKWMTDEEKIFKEISFESASRDNIVNVSALFQIISKSSDILRVS